MRGKNLAAAAKFGAFDPALSEKIAGTDPTIKRRPSSIIYPATMTTTFSSPSVARLAVNVSSLAAMIIVAATSPSAAAFQIIHQPPTALRRSRPITSLFEIKPTATTLQQQYSSIIDVTENAPRGDTGTLTEWAVSYGVQISDCFELVGNNSYDVNGDDIYSISNQYVGIETPILCVPSDLILTGQKARQELGAETYGAENTLPLSDHQPFYVFLKILKEYELGDKSPWYYWMNSLPRYFCNGASMTDFCFGCLPPYAAGLALSEKSRMKQFVQALDNVSFLSLESKRDVDLTTWAYNVVFTRSMENEWGDTTLVPIVDYFNHGAEANVYITYDVDGNGYAYTARDIAPAEPLLFTYGDSTNPSYLLARYGFLDESAPATFCKYVIDNPTFEMFNLGYPNKMIFYNDGGISNEVWDVLLYELLSKVSPEEQQAFYQAHMMGDDSIKASYHDQYFGQTFQLIQNHVNFILNELDELGIGLEIQMAQGQDAQLHPRLPLIMRHNEFVKRTFEDVQKLLDNMMFV